MFYTKYRPQKFSEISRPNQVADALTAQVLSQKVGHAYLFVGPRGTGKTSTARILAKALNCEKLDKNGDPCCKCSSCLQIASGSYLDLIEIDAASNRGIDDIRELKNKIKLAPTQGKNKIYIIDEVHMLTTEAFNALLKTLEEPPKNTIFILCTTELHKVPDTIKSRCQVFKFKRASLQQIADKLEKISKAEKIKISRKDLEHIAKASMGGFRDAETLLQQISDGEISVEALLSSSDKQQLVDFIGYLYSKDISSALILVNKIYEDGGDLSVWVGELLKYLRDALLIKSGVSADVLELPEELLLDIKKQIEPISVSWFVFVLNKFLDTPLKLKNSIISQLPVELAVVEICGYTGMDDSQIKKINLPKTPAPVSTPPKTLNATKITKEPESIKPEPSVSISSKLKPTPVSVAVAAPIEDVSEFDSAEELEIALELSHIEEKWQEVMQKVDEINKSVLGLLKAGKPIRVEGRFLVLEVFYAFHKERLESPKNRSIVEKALKEIFSAPISVRCVISTEKPKKLKPGEVGVLTDINVVGVDKMDKAAVLDMLDGGLPL